MLKWPVRIVVGFVGVIALLLAAGFGYELVSASRDANRIDPPVVAAARDGNSVQSAAD
jgi:hypothetical protein